MRKLVANASVVGMLSFGFIRSAQSTCAFSFGLPRLIVSTTCQGGLRISVDGRATRSRVAVASGTRTNSKLCLWAKATARVLEVDTFGTSVDEFENELDSMASESDVEDADCNMHLSEAAEPQTVAKMSLLQSNIRILEKDCDVGRLMLNAARARENWLYMGLDISTSSTGYAVLKPSTAAPAPASDTSKPPDSPRQEEVIAKAGKTRLVEWGCIPGGGGKKDVVDVGVVVEESLRQVEARCRRRASGDCSSNASEELSGAGGVLPEPEPSDDGPVWVVGVEDFMRRFLPGKSNARSMFALAQLNGIVKYACQKHLGAKASSFHPSTPRSFYGLMTNKPEGKGMKEIVHDFVLRQEEGLHSRYEWPLSADGSKEGSSYDVTDAYLVALYSWHRDVYRAVADDELAKTRFVESFQALHAEKLIAAEQRSLKRLMDDAMPPARGKKIPKPMTERSARNAHRKLEDKRLTKAYETALMHWFRRRVLGIEL